MWLVTTELDSLGLEEPTGHGESIRGQALPVLWKSH